MGNLFTSKQAYKYLLGQTIKVQQFTWLWKTECRGKHKFFFFWLLVLDRLNTRNILNRKNMHLPSYSCILCNAVCPFSSWWCRLLNINWNLAVPILDRLLMGKNCFSEPSIFMEIIIVSAWCIWMTRNRTIFHSQSLSLWYWKSLLREELSLTTLRCKSSKKSILRD